MAPRVCPPLLPHLLFAPMLADLALTLLLQPPLLQALRVSDAVSVGSAGTLQRDSRAFDRHSLGPLRLDLPCTLLLPSPPFHLPSLLPRLSLLLLVPPLLPRLFTNMSD